MFPFEVDSTTDVPLWVQLRQRLIYLINSGYFKPGDQLPTVRGLAYLESTRGRGVFVRDLDAEMDEEYTKDVDGIMSDCVAACRDLGLSLDDVQKCMIKKIKQIKKDEGLEPPLERVEGTGRIVPVDVGTTARKARTGA